MNKSTESDSTGRGGTGTTCSPWTPKDSRLVARIRSLVQRCNASIAKSNDGVEHVLAVVEHEEHVAVPDALGDGLTSRQPVAWNKAERGRHERCDVGRIVGISEFHHPHTAGES